MNVEEKESKAQNLIPGDWPLWRVALKKMREREDFGYGMTIETPWFERAFGVPRDSSSFAFQMLDLRGELEEVDGYYMGAQTIQHEETGMRTEVWQIPSAKDHEDVALGFEGRMKRYARRAVELRLKTLDNPEAELEAGDRTRMEASARIAATRMVLLRREKSIADAVRKHAPHLLDAKKELAKS